MTYFIYKLTKHVNCLVFIETTFINNIMFFVNRSSGRFSRYSKRESDDEKTKKTLNYWTLIFKYCYPNENQLYYSIQLLIRYYKIFMG